MASIKIVIDERFNDKSIEYLLEYFCLGKEKSKKVRFVLNGSVVDKKKLLEEIGYYETEFDRLFNYNYQILVKLKEQGAFKNILPFLIAFSFHRWRDPPSRREARYKCDLVGKFGEYYFNLTYKRK